MIKLNVNRIRKCNLFAIFAYLSIRFQVFVKEYQRKVIGEFYVDDLKGRHYNLLLGQEVIGVARIIDREHTIELGRVAVRKEYRGQGHGKKFISLLIDEIKSTNALKPISLFAADSSLIGFYRQLGFVENGEVYFDEGPCTNMIKVI